MVWNGKLTSKQRDRIRVIEKKLGSSDWMLVPNGVAVVVVMVSSNKEQVLTVSRDGKVKFWY